MNPFAVGRSALPEKVSDTKSRAASLAPTSLETSSVYYAVYEALPVTPQDRPRNARRRRCWHYVACSILFIGAMRVLHKGPASLSLYPGRLGYRYGFSQCSESVNWTKSFSDTEHSPDKLPYHAQTSFALPLSSDVISFISEGTFQSGDFTIVQDLDAGSDSAQVDVRVAYRHPDALEEATVCQIDHNNGTRALGIFTPRWRPPNIERNLIFHLTLRLPAAVDQDAPLKVNTLETDLPLFAHNLPELADSVYFERMSLKSTNAPMSTDSVAGKHISFHASNGAISGTFNTSTSLLLETANAPIGVFVNLVNGNGGPPTRLTLKTKNGRIDGDIALVSNTTDGTQGSYYVYSRSTNAPVKLGFLDAPADSHLDLEARTSNSPVNVTLHKTYDGTFDLLTSMWYPSIEWQPDVEDPKDLGRNRHVHVDEIKGAHAAGYAVWASGGEKNGTVVLRTSNSSVRLSL